MEPHYGKTVLMNNSHARSIDNRKHLKIGQRQVKVLEEGGSMKYLGRTLRLDRHHDVEIEACINLAWRKFMVMRGELCCKAFALRKRFRLFGATVSRPFLYGAGTWTLTA